MVAEGRGQKYPIFPGGNGVHHSEAMAAYVHMIYGEIYIYIYPIADTKMSFVCVSGGLSVCYPFCCGYQKVAVYTHFEYKKGLNIIAIKICKKPIFFMFCL